MSIVGCDELLNKNPAIPEVAVRQVDRVVWETSGKVPSCISELPVNVVTVSNKVVATRSAENPVHPTSAVYDESLVAWFSCDEQ